MSWMEDDPDFEVTDLRTGLPDERVYTHDDKRERRKRWLVAGVITLALLCALVAPFFKAPGLGATIRQALRLIAPTPAASLAQGGDVVYFQHGLPWGALRIDGRLVTKVDVAQPYTGFEPLYTSLRIPRGRHLLTYTAEPFPTLRCWISAPAKSADTCPLIQERGSPDVKPPLPAVRVLNLGGDPSSLTPSLQASLEAAAASAIASLSTSTTLAPGDSYAGATGARETASGQMTATLSYALANDPANGYVIPGVRRGCAILCVIQTAPYINDAQAQWDVAAHVYPIWTYTQGNGAAAIQIQGSPAPPGVLPDGIVALNITWDGAWRVKVASSPDANPTCLIGLNLLAAQQPGDASQASMRVFPAPTPAEGCLMVADAQGGAGARRDSFAVMYRFGLLFAMDDEAAKLFPGLPTADARLHKLAHAWITAGV